MIQIKQISKDEAFIINQLAREIWPEAFKEILSPEQIEYMLDWMYDVNTLEDQARIGHLFFIVTKDGIPEGFLGLEPNYPDAGTLRIHKLYVKPNKHNSGLGKALLVKAEEIANRLEFDTINLNVNRFNKAVGFYKHLGFKTVKEEDIDIGRGYLMEDFVMVKKC
ncbi:MAG: GNAT family N-acetyltransferase [Crocinitomicaceae bacterium]|nr:GNAT family N-acetyltransferase [Crocinitomicaceae bacterium]